MQNLLTNSNNTVNSYLPPLTSILEASFTYCEKPCAWHDLLSQMILKKNF